MELPSNFAARWGSPLHRLDFADPRPILPSATVSFLHYAGVPRAFELRHAQRLEIRFLACAQSMEEAWSAAIKDLALPALWKKYWRIGTITFTQATAWLCIEEVTGSIVAIDLDIDEPVYAINSSLPRMMSCMKYLLDWSIATGGRLSLATELEKAWAADPDLDGDATAFWSPVIRGALDAQWDCIDILITWMFALLFSPVRHFTVHCALVAQRTPSGRTVHSVRPGMARGKGVHGDRRAAADRVARQHVSRSDRAPARRGRLD